MPTKSEFGLGVLYHATPTHNVEAILVKGLDSVPNWLAYFKEDAFRSAIQTATYAESVTVLAINLPQNWKLEKAGTGEYLSWSRIPPKYIRKERN